MAKGVFSKKMIWRWLGRAKKEIFRCRRLKNWSSWERNEDEGGYRIQMEGKGRAHSPSPLCGATDDSDSDGLSGKMGSNETLHNLEKESRDSGSNFGGTNICNKS
jgi:hypothetical protein